MPPLGFSRVGGALGQAWRVALCAVPGLGTVYTDVAASGLVQGGGDWKTGLWARRVWWAWWWSGLPPGVLRCVSGPAGVAGLVGGSYVYVYLFYQLLR